jgi:type IV secretion system protein VirD4
MAGEILGPWRRVSIPLASAIAVGGGVEVASRVCYAYGVADDFVEIAPLFSLVLAVGAGVSLASRLKFQRWQTVAVGVLTAVGWISAIAVPEGYRVVSFSHLGIAAVTKLDSAIFMGSLVAIGIVIGLVKWLLMGVTTGVIRSRQGAHGDSNWMTMEVAQKLFPATGQVVVGEAYRVDLEPAGRFPFMPKDKASWGSGGKKPILAFDLDFDSTHMMFFAGSGGYKTTSTVVPTALRYPGSMVVLDPSVEVGPLVEQRRKDMARKVVALDPNAEVVQGFNAFESLLKSDKMEEDCAAFARLFVAESKGTGGGSSEYFQSQAINMLAGLLFLVATDAQYDEKRNLSTVRSLIAQPTLDVQALLALKVANPKVAKFVRENLGQFVGMAEQTFSGVLSSVAKDTAWLSIPAYAMLVCGRRFTLDELPEGNLDVWVQIPGQTLKTYPGVGRVIIGSLMNAMVQADGRHANRVLFVLDEVDLLGYMSPLEEARDRGRKYGITLMLMYQSLGQLEGHFSKEGATSWLEGCSFVSFAAIKSMDTAEAISARCGQMTIEVENVSRQTNASIFSSGGGGITTSKAAQARDLILAHEIVANMRADEQIVFVRGQPPLRCGRAVYFRRPEMASATGTNRFAGKAAASAKV